MKKIILICLALTFPVSCTTMSEYNREHEAFRVEQMKGVNLPPKNVIDCYNILGLDRVVPGKMVMGGSRPVLESVNRHGRVIMYLPDRNFIALRYTYIGMDPQPYFTMSVLMLIARDGNIYAVSREEGGVSFDPSELQVKYFIYRSKTFSEVKYEALPEDVTVKIAGTYWPRVEYNY